MICQTYLLMLMAQKLASTNRKGSHFKYFLSYYVGLKARKRSLVELFARSCPTFMFWMFYNCQTQFCPNPKHLHSEIQKFLFNQRNWWVCIGFCHFYAELDNILTYTYFYALFENIVLNCINVLIHLSCYLDICFLLKN